MDDIIKIDENCNNTENNQNQCNNRQIKFDDNNIDMNAIVNKLLKFINLVDMKDKIKVGTEYVVQIPTEFQKAFDNGEYWIMKNEKSGKIWPNLMKIGENGKKQIVTPLQIKEQNLIKGNPFNDIVNQFDNIYNQQKINELSSLIETTLDTVKKIEKGQTADRIGLLNAGKQAVILALSQKNDESRQFNISNGLNNIIIAQGQILETMKDKINSFKAISQKKILQIMEEFKKSNYLDSKDEEYNQIVEYFNLYLQATNFLANIYIIDNDYNNAKKVFDIAIDEVKNIDFSKVKTIEYIHNTIDEKIYIMATDYVETEKAICLSDYEESKYLSISINGEKLLEAINNEKTISE